MEVFFARNAPAVLVWVLVAALGAVLLVGGLYFVVFLGGPMAVEPERLGQAGDFFGGLLNPLLSFLSVFALLVALVLQNRELRLSREALKVSQTELELSRKAQAASASALEEQNRVLQQQRMEQTFFSWLATYREILGEVQHDTRGGRAALWGMWDESLCAPNICVTETYFSAHVPLPNVLSAHRLENLDGALPAHYPHLSKAARETWERVYVGHGNSLESFYRVLYRLIKWIDDQPASRLSWEDKWLYVSIVRSQLSWIEQVFLFYNGMTDRGKNFKAYINRYALFDNLTVERDRLLVILRECPMDSVGYAESAYSSDAARAAHDAEEAAKKAPPAAP